MTATAASPPWPAAGAGNERTAWRFGRAIERRGGQAMEWALRRNCSLEPRQLLGVYLSICVVSMAIAGAFGAIGATPVLAYAGIELALLGAALLAYGRHAADYETITLEGEALRIEHGCGSKVERAEFRAAGVCVEPLHAPAALVELSGQGRVMRIGRYLRPELRAPLAQELCRALRSARAAA